MDVLSDVLSWLRVEGTVSRKSVFTAPWGVGYPKHQVFAFMTVEHGHCTVAIDGQPPILFQTGDLLMFSPGLPATLSDSAHTAPIPYAQVLKAAGAGSEVDANAAYPTLEYGGGGRQTVLHGWGLRFDSYEQHPLLSLLPPFIHITNDARKEDDWLDMTVRFIRHEAQRGSNGSRLMVIRLIDLLFVQVLRAWFESQPIDQAGWVGALRDSAIRKAIGQLHAQPAHPWTVESLGRSVGMSRSSFSSRFGALVGKSPIKYLTELRMNLARNALRQDPGLAISELAHQVGYDSQSSFCRAFKRHFDVPPATLRRR